MELLGNLAEGTIVKKYEGGVPTEFVVAKHDYGSDLNGTGHTLVVRKNALSEKREWANYGSMSATDYLNWKEHSTLRSWLEEEYAQNFSADFLAKVKPMKIRYSYRGTEGIMEDARFYVPRKSDGFADELKSILPYNYWTRDTRNESYTNGDSPPVTSYYGEVYCVGKGWRDAPSDKQEVLPCFALYNDVRVDDNGILWENRTPEIRSYYFGMQAAYRKRSPFRLPYSVHDEDGDGITVTESLNGTILHTFMAADSATYYFAITQDMLDSMSAEIDQVMKVSATDGDRTTEKAYRFRKITGSGYKVYIGKIKGSPDGTGYYWAERHLLHDAANENAPIVLDPELTLEGNEPGSFSFTLPRTNPHYDKIALKTAVISVEEDGSEIFMGRVTEWNKTFDLDMEVTCEGELGYLQDRDCIIEEKTYTSTELMTLAVTADNRFAQEGKAFNLGVVTKEKTGTDKDEKETKGISDCWSVAKDYLADKYGGYLRLRKTVTLENGVRVYRRYLDYMDMPPDRTDQIIRFGTNLLDLSYDLRSNQIVNSIIVIGYETTGWFIFSHTKEIRVEVKNEDSIKEFGLCQRYMTVDGTKSTRESLLKKGEEELKKSTDQFAGSITVNAADLADIGVDTDRLEFMKQARIISEAHGLANWVLCTKEVIPLDAPEEKEYTFGETSQNLSALQAKNFGTAGKAWNAIQSTIKYVKSGG